MSKTELSLYIAFLSLLKKGACINKSNLAREAKVKRQIVYRQLEKHTYQDLEQFKK